MLDPAESADRLERELHQRLSEIFHEHSLSTSTSSQIKEFFRAFEHSEQSSIMKQQLLEQELDLERHFLEEEYAKLSLLWIVLLAGYWDLVELLARNGADVNEPYGFKIRFHLLNLSKYSTLLHALLQMDPSSERNRLIRLVVDHGADLEARDNEGKTALHLAVKERQVQLTEMLLEKGADVNGVDREGATPLLVAAGEQLPILIKLGADVFAKDMQGRNVLHQLSGRYRVEHVDLARDLIEKGVSFNDREKLNQFQPIHMAARVGNNELVKLYLDLGADVNSRAHDDFSPLYLAVLNRSMATVKTLLERGAVIHQRRAHTDGRALLHEACQFYEMENMEVLLSAGANVPLALILNWSHKENPSVRLMIRTLALKKVSTPGIRFEDEDIIERDSKMRNYYRVCVDKVWRMKKARFIETCTLFDLLAKCRCQIAALMRNSEFESKFKLYDMKGSGFAPYAEDAVRAFERAEEYHCAMLKQESVIDEAVYGIFPYLVVRKIVRHIINDCCGKNKGY